MKISTIITGPELLTKIEKVSDVRWRTGESPSNPPNLKYPYVLYFEETVGFYLTYGISGNSFALFHVSNYEFIAKCKEMCPKRPNTVKIEIEVEVPDWGEDVGVDRNGEIYAYEGEVEACTAAFGCTQGRCSRLFVENWRDTLTKVNKE